MCKAVEHGVLLEELKATYPDALFVWTHRDAYPRRLSGEHTCRDPRALRRPRTIRPSWVATPFAA